MKKERIGTKIKKIRKARSLTQKELADALGYSDKSMITHIEKGDSDMTYEKMLLLMREYALNANELFDVSEIDPLIKKHQKDKKQELIKKLFFNPTIDYIKKIKEVDFKNVLSNDDICFKPIVCDDDLQYCLLSLETVAEQKENISYILSKAYLSPNEYYPFIVCLNDGTRIGFICLNKWQSEKDSFSFLMSIDGNYQNEKYTILAAKLAIEVFRTIDNKCPIKIFIKAEDKSAQQVYKSLGFKQSTKSDGKLIFVL